MWIRWTGDNTTGCRSRTDLLQNKSVGTPKRSFLSPGRLLLLLPLLLPLLLLLILLLLLAIMANKIILASNYLPLQTACRFCLPSANYWNICGRYGTDLLCVRACDPTVMFNEMTNTDYTVKTYQSETCIKLKTCLYRKMYPVAWTKWKTWNCHW